MTRVAHPLATTSVVALFTDDSNSEASTCIYVDSSFSSEFDVDSSELNSSFSNNSEGSFSDETYSEPGIENLRFYYTNADCLLNKMGELQVLISIVKPDLIVVTELFPRV